MPYDINLFNPSYGGVINSSGNVVNVADTLDEATGQFKPPALKSYTMQNAAGAIGAGTPANIKGYSVLSIRVVITGTATVTFEASTDGTNYNSIYGNTLSGAVQNTTSSTGDFRFNIAGFEYFQARISSWTSGTVTVTGDAGAAGIVMPFGTIAAFGSADTNSTGSILQGVGAYNLLFDGTNWARQRFAVDSMTAGVMAAGSMVYDTTGAVFNKQLSALSAGDGHSGNKITTSALMSFNGTTWDRVRTVAVGDSAGAGLLGSGNYVYDSVGTVWNRWRSASGAADGSSGTVFGAFTQMNYNGATWDRNRNNMVGTILSSAARTGTTNSSDFTNYNHRGIVLSLNITSASGTGGLQVLIQVKDSIAVVYRQLNTSPTAITAAGQYIYMLYPGIDGTNNNNNQNISQVLPQIFRIQVVHGDASSYTYSVNYHMIL